MKKIAAVVGVILMLFGCSGNKGPSASVEGYLREFKKMSIQGMNEYRVNQGDITQQLYQEGDAVGEAFGKLLMDLDYKLSNETIDGDTATVDIEVTTYNFGKLFGEVFTEYFTVGMQMAFSGAAEEEILAKFNEIFFDKSKGIKKDSVFKATVHLVKQGERWLVDDEDTANIEFMNAITGDFLALMQSMN